MAAPLPAQTLDGTWRLDDVKPFGVTIHTYMVLHQSGSRFDGTVLPNGSWPLPLRNARLEGADLVFGTEWGWNFRVRREGDHLRVTVTYDGGTRRELLGVAASPDELKAPAALPLPALATLPWNGLARTPPMGWNSWNHFAEAVDDRVVRETADAMVASGMAAAGYTYVNIDDTWEAGRDAQGAIVANAKFPDMKALCDYVHARGLKLGLYSSPGPLTCGGYPGSFGHEEQDARTFAAWGVDYLKYDWCSAGRIYPESALRAGYQKMGSALQRCGRPIVFSLCEYGMADVWTWGGDAGGNLWRTSGDIADNWTSMAAIGFNQGRLARYAGPGHWNDPDMLEVGNGGMSAAEYRTHFSLWCMLAAPLIAGNDLRRMGEETRDILTNREVIALDQDPLGAQAVRRIATEGVEIWVKPLSGGAMAVGVFNRNLRDRDGGFLWSQLGLTASPRQVRDLWLHRDIEGAGEGWRTRVPGHGVVVLRVVP